MRLDPLGRETVGGASGILFDKLETIIELLLVLIGVTPTQSLVARYPDIQSQGGTAIQRSIATSKVLEVLVAASLPSAPEQVQTYTVGTQEEPLAKNESMPLMRVSVTNLNVAQPLLVSKKGVVPSAGGIILARGTEHYVLPIGSSLYGIVAVGTILVSVGTGYDIQTRVSELLAQK